MENVETVKVDNNAVQGLVRSPDGTVVFPEIFRCESVLSDEETERVARDQKVSPDDVARAYACYCFDPTDQTGGLSTWTAAAVTHANANDRAKAGGGLVIRHHESREAALAFLEGVLEASCGSPTWDWSADDLESQYCTLGGQHFTACWVPVHPSWPSPLLMYQAWVGRGAYRDLWTLMVGPDGAPFQEREAA